MERSLNCIICCQKTHLIKDDKYSDIYYKCPRCEAIFLQRDHILDKKMEKTEYDRHENTMDNNGYVNSFRELIDKYIIEFTGDLKGKKILDFGCGPNPVLSEILKKYEADVVHYDPYFFKDISFKSEQFDIVVSTEVFEHLSNPYNELKLIKDLLKKDSFLIIKTQFHNMKDDDFLTWWYRRDPTHIIFYTSKTFEYMAKKTGFVIMFSDNEEIIVLKKEF